ncbi:class I SAM-dependent methyltransferase [Sphingomonas daechungensis]|uniref:class I SAM-dependent methyltransferase n=1 Tax=Sphingomonas daechungensis TaxID=1176646 RepID=UPI0037844157
MNVNLRVDLHNLDPKTVEGFGEEWGAYTQLALNRDEHRRMFDQYFAIFPFEKLPGGAEGFDLGCGSGRWAELVAEKVGRLHCIDPSAKALAVAQRRLERSPNTTFHQSGVDSIPLPDASQDFGYSLGVLHHIPDPQAGLRSCVAKLKPGAPFLVYLYYAFDNRPRWFRWLWRGSDVLRRGLSQLPFRLRKAVTTLIAALVYWPLARTALALGKLGIPVEAFPLSAYSRSSFYTMRTDALDRFGTRLEHRFERAEIELMMRDAGLENIRFHDGIPYWVACGFRRR